MVELDLIGMSCPLPVVYTRRAIQKGVFPITVLCSDKHSVIDLTLLCEKHKVQITHEEIDDLVRFTLTK